jgi:hypothetical protein
VTGLERHCRWLLRAYTAWYRRKRAEEMLGTLLDASPPGKRWPSFRDARALVIGGIRTRGLVWRLSILWAGIGAAGAGYSFFITTKPYTDSDFWIPQWNTEPWVIFIAAWLAVLAWLVLPIPVLIAGFVRLRSWRQDIWPRAAAWVGAWAAGFEFMHLAYVWSEYPWQILGRTCSQGSCVLDDYGPAVVSWGALAICAAWLALGAAMTLILARPAHGWDVADTSSRSSGKASIQPPGAGDLPA